LEGLKSVRICNYQSCVLLRYQDTHSPRRSLPFSDIIRRSHRRHRYSSAEMLGTLRGKYSSLDVIAARRGCLLRLIHNALGVALCCARGTGGTRKNFTGGKNRVGRWLEEERRKSLHREGGGSSWHCFFFMSGRPGWASPRRKRGVSNAFPRFRYRCCRCNAASLLCFCKSHLCFVYAVNLS